MPDYSKNYDWPKTLSYDADVTIVCTERGPGKTYGLRCSCVSDWLKRKYRFVEVCRTKDEAEDVSRDYHKKLVENGEYPGYLFKTDRTGAYIAPKPADEKEKPQWEQYGYFVAMTMFQRIKKKTFSRVRKIILDEAAIDSADKYHGYLKREFYVLQEIVNSCSRERAQDEAGIEPRVYLLMNAVDMLNPYFAAYGIDKEPRPGYTWHAGKTCLLHYVPRTETGQANLTHTVAGRMAKAAGTSTASYTAAFENAGSDWIADKPSRARFEFGLVYKGKKLGVWLDDQDGYYYVNGRVPEGHNRPVYALTADDGRINYVMAKRGHKALKTFADLYYLGIVKYDTYATRDAFMKAMAMFGIVS